jgi:ribosomal protein S18 acetylase RimI-like enzyme
MTAALAGLPVLKELPERLEIRRVADVDQLEAFALTITQDREALRYYQSAAEIVLQAAAPQWFYLGYVDRKPVATAEVTIGGGVAGLYNITTLQNHRGQGIGSFMTWHALQEARMAGVPAAVLQASAAGAGVYRRLGFRSFGEIVEYKPTGGDFPP